MLVGDLGGTNCRVGVANAEGLVDHETVPTPQDPDQLFSVIGEQILRFADRYPQIRRGAFGIPGPIDRSGDLPLVTAMANVANWKEPFEINERLRAEQPSLHGFDIMPLNDAEAATHGAARVYSPDENETPLLYLTVSTGVGGDVIQDYETFSYKTGVPMEIGHIPFMHPRGFASYTLENRVSGPAISRLYGWDYGPGRQRSAQELVKDPAAGEVWRKVGKDLAQGIVFFVPTFGIRHVVIGGGVGANAQNRLRTPVREQLRFLFRQIPRTVTKGLDMAQPPRLRFVERSRESKLGLVGCYFAVQQREPRPA